MVYCDLIIEDMILCSGTVLLVDLSLVLVLLWEKLVWENGIILLFLC